MASFWGFTISHHYWYQIWGHPNWVLKVSYCCFDGSIVTTKKSQQRRQMRDFFREIVSRKKFLPDVLNKTTNVDHLIATGWKFRNFLATYQILREIKHCSCQCPFQLGIWRLSLILSKFSHKNH